MVVSDVYNHSDVPDLAGLITPWPLLIRMRVQDTASFIGEQLAGRENLWKDMHPGEHACANNEAHEFYGKYL